uniref:SJCHGC09157 protein n=1 Tax=Schistosoma japonicum TaxID=6182 RepID=Q5DCP1_SCHJA|nr:SJCHGC09157 protein [Schistosoma japonicum]
MLDFLLGKVITRKLVTCAAYAAACQEVANTNDVSFVNLYEAMLVQKSWESFFSDGLHFSRRGSEFLAKILEDFFADKLSDLKWWFPDWRAIDPITPETSINHYHRSNT